MRLDQIEEKVEIPAGVKFEIANGLLTVEGPKGKLERPIDPRLDVKLEGTTATITMDTSYRPVTCSAADPTATPAVPPNMPTPMVKPPTLPVIFSG